MTAVGKFVVVPCDVTDPGPEIEAVNSTLSGQASMNLTWRAGMSVQPLTCLIRVAWCAANWERFK